jgi:hypothetical protein
VPSVTVLLIVWIAPSTWRSCPPSVKASSPSHAAASLLFFAVRAFSLRASALAVVLPLLASRPYRAPVAIDFLVEIFSPLQSWNFCTVTNLSRMSASAMFSLFDRCCFYYFVRNSLVALLAALCARIFSFKFVNIGFFLTHFFLCMCVCKVFNKAFLPPLSTRLLCPVVSIPLVC